MNVIIEKKVFESNSPDRGFTVKAHYLKEPKGDALVEILRDGEPYRRFLYPAYKVWNIAAHFNDIVDSEIAGNCEGYDLAGWTGFSVVWPRTVSEWDLLSDDMMYEVEGR
jgi:hypothetical protein